VKKLILLLLICLYGCSWHTQSAQDRFPNKNPNIYEYLCWRYCDCYVESIIEGLDCSKYK
jgi:hypothetical protein